MLEPYSGCFVEADKRKHKEHTRTVVEEAHSFAVGTVRIRTFEDAFAEA